MMNNEKIERVHVLYTGRVQGVGFRFTTHQIAQQFPITGYVRNCPDGSVELVAEGTYEEILNFLHAVLTRSFSGSRPLANLKRLKL